LDSEEFSIQLDEAHSLMSNEEYKEAINILEKLEEIEKESNFNYNLTHRLYQLLSNAHSLFNQQVISKRINILSKEQNKISFGEIIKTLRENDELEIDDLTIRREIELLILRKQLNCMIKGNNLVFN
jgi:hypothetical protein